MERAVVDQRSFEHDMRQFTMLPTIDKYVGLCGLKVAFGKAIDYYVIVEHMPLLAQDPFHSSISMEPSL
jgi:hypothetical protein